MPHQTHLRTFGRLSPHRRSMLRNLTLSVLRYEKVRTTEAKAKEIRRFVDRMIGLGKDGSLEARRRATAWLPEPEIVEKVFSDLAQRYPDRSSGYTRITRVGHRVGDHAPLIQIELMPGHEETKEEEAAAEEAAKPRRRLGLPRRKKAEAAEEAEKPAKRTAAKKTTPRKKTTATKAKT
ncbi:MAG TPA: 50S ribosomal protein L17 [Candidatus Limnocylindria bacterium]|nr:50S ribosomal protein L17 [Candidatus Limnocylindria bacterium]